MNFILGFYFPIIYIYSLAYTLQPREVLKFVLFHTQLPRQHKTVYTHLVSLLYVRACPRTSTIVAATPFT